MSIKLTIHGLQTSGVDSLTGKEGETITVSFDDGTVTEAALSQKSLMQLLRMKLAQPGKPAPAAQPAPKPAQAAPAVPAGNAPPK